MSRPGRVFFDGAVYHVYNRLARGERVFDDAGEATAFCGLLREVVQRDGLTVFAWCLMPNHYHLALRTGVVSLDRPMRSLQQRVTRGVNSRRRVYGPLWQGRYRAKLVEDQRYLDQLLVYIHLNPVSAGVVDDPANYPWSGHREVMGQVRSPIVDVDEVLGLFGTSRRSARSAYVRQLKGAEEREWIGEEPGRLPWWRLGRPPAEEHEDPEEAVRAKREQQAAGPDSRPVLAATDYLARGAAILGLSTSDLRGRRRGRDLVSGREVLAAVGVERYRLRVTDIAEGLGKSPDTITKALARAGHRRREDGEFQAVLDRLDLAIAEGVKQEEEHNGGMA